jgi:hypothetical protein
LTSPTRLPLGGRAAWRVGDEAFRDGAGRTGLVFAVAPDKVLAFGKNPYTQARYRFPA